MIKSVPQSPNTRNLTKGLGIKTPIQNFLESKKFSNKIKKRRNIKKRPLARRVSNSFANQSFKRASAQSKLIKKKSRKKSMSFASDIDNPNKANENSQPPSARGKRYNSLARAISNYDNSQSNVTLIEELPEELMNTGRDRTCSPPPPQQPAQQHPRATGESKNSHPSNFKGYPQLLEDDAPPQQKLVEQRNIDYSYDGYNMSFIERIINLDFIDDSPGYRAYIKDCKVQIKVARELRRTLRAMPFRGAVDVPRTHECKPSSPNPIAKKLLLLDLDETLIHSEMLEPGAPGNPDHDFILDIPLNDGTMDIEVRVAL